MPRRGNVPKRDVLPDPVYGSKVDQVHQPDNVRRQERYGARNRLWRI